jgi:nucleotide-binding universal stress UspA family protein
MFRHALLASDLSPASDRMIACLHGLRALSVNQITLLHALGVRHLEEMAQLLAQAAETHLARQVGALETQDFKVDSILAPGAPAQEILRVARERDASMIVVGSQGASIARDRLLGGVAQEVLHRSEVPVFIARLRYMEGPEPACEMVCQDFLQHVLFATDFSDTADHAFSNLEELVRQGCRRITLIHVQDESRIGGHLHDRLEEFNRIGEGRLERLATRLGQLGATDVRIRLPYGFPKQEILKEAEAEGYSLILMGSQGRGYFGDILLGSLAHHISRHAPIPTLLIPPVR